GLTNDNVYYAIVNPSAPQTLRLAASQANALAGQAVTLTAAGSGSNQHLWSVGAPSRTFEAGSRVNSSTATIDLGYNHGFVTGERVIYHNGGGVSIGGLQDGAVYYAIVPSGSPTQLQLASSLAAAQAGTALPLTPATAGQSIELVKSTSATFDSS